MVIRKAKTIAVKVYNTVTAPIRRQRNARQQQDNAWREQGRRLKNKDY